ncbi:LPS-assembly protein LptD [Gemmobacter lutimaris]|uniref:LPS-assembly protein LptD n=1 Tax=Gemmobacter lutimaris TaxID=2306023 RepID=A0A398BYE1_9RHOB|nr:LPS assembly protein LptD [Gemmobacter lutimaris]RID93448.1 LPS-assembly protein LptD [Gemmobacter lutimaris]
MRWRASLFALALAVLPLGGQGQTVDRATLTASQVSVSGDSLLVAQGDVEVRYRGQRLRAQRIVYDRAADRLRFEGPIYLSDEKGNFVRAETADLSADLTEGVLNSARMVMNRQMQIAARQMFRAGGRYTQLTDTVASSCQVCTIDPVPLWEIRAKRVIHDQLEQQLYFDRAQLRFAGVPVFYLPRLRMPDPTLDRATGVMMPDIRTTSGLGTGIKVPYFITLGPSRDLTVTPYLTTKNGRTLELRYREAFRTGRIEITGATSRDDILPGEARGYLNASGDFALPRDFRLTFQAEAVSDPAYLLDYGISDKDRLDSRIEVTRTRRNEYISGRFINFRSIRDIDGVPESNATLPTLIGDFTLHRRFSGGPLGGEAGLMFQTHSHYRTSTLDYDTGADTDTIADGRDMSRASLRLDWRRNWVTGPGIVASTMAEVSADLYNIRQDATYGGTHSRLHGAAALELRWPWVGGTRDGATHVIEPVMQLVFASRDGSNIPNEDSALVEFDEGNLFALDRFAGSDAHEDGARLNVGLSWTRYAPSGWSLALAGGRVFRREDFGQFSTASGLDGVTSDWLATAQVTVPGGLSLTNRALFDGSFGITKAEFRLDLDREKYALSTSYIWLQADAAENRTADTQELYLDGRYALTDTWTGKLSGRYDFEADRATRAGLGLEFRNECLLVDLSLSRRFTSSTSVKPTTDFGLSVDLLGFGGSAKPGPAKKCRG